MTMQNSTVTFTTTRNPVLMIMNVFSYKKIPKVAYIWYNMWTTFLYVQTCVYCWWQFCCWWSGRLYQTWKWNLRKKIVKPFSRNDIPSDEMIQCEMCDFASARKTELKNHKMLSHNWCHICFSSFVFRDSLKNHIPKKHSNNGRLSGPQTGEAPR
jgi:hypothetical protein